MSAIERFGLYLVLTDPVAGYARCAEAAVAADVRYVQLRMKDAPRAELLGTAQRLRAIMAGTSTRFIVNDDSDLAAEAGADGAHLGQEDEPLATARRRHPALRIWGLSTHNETQAAAAAALAPDYIGVGPIFASTTKVTGRPALGLDGLRKACEATSLPVVAIGGVTLADVAEARAAGASGIAMIADLLVDGEVQARTRRAVAAFAAAVPAGQGG